MITLRKLQTLTWAEQRGLGEALLLLPLINLGLHLLGLRRLQQLLIRLAMLPTTQAGTTRPDAARQPRVQQLARLVSIAARYGPYRASCLRRALLLWWWLQREGLASELRIGTRFTANQLEAHAWVEVQGQPIWEDHQVHQMYAVFPKAIQPSLGVSRS